MEKEIDTSIIKATQTSLGKYVKRPPLSEKLLRKPPFRFLHDIVTTVLKTTGFFEGLFEDDELVSDNVKDRDSKILFLNKVISVVGLTTGQTLSIKASKIIAGQEADKTNELLQYLAQALDNKLSSDEAVKKYKGNSNLQQPEKKKKETTKAEATKTNKKSNDKKLTSKSSEKLTSNKKDLNARAPSKDGEKVNNSKTKQKDNTLKNEPTSVTTVQQSRTLQKNASLEKQASLEVRKPQKILDNKDDDNLESNVETKETYDQNDSNRKLNEDLTKLEDKTSEESKTVHDPVREPDEPQDLDNSFTIENQLDSTLSSQDLMESVDDKIPENNSLENNIEVGKEKNIIANENSGQILDDRLFTNKTENDDNNHHIANNENMNNYFSPKRQMKNIRKNSSEEVNVKSPIKVNNNVARPQSVRPSSSRPGAPRLRDKHETVVTESENLIVGKVNIIAENAPIEEEEDSSVIITEQEINSLVSSQNKQEHIQFPTSNEHGHLVQQILESQKEFSQNTGKTEIEWQFGAQKAREAVNRELEQLRYNMQGLSRVANPLGKLLDHIQEDVEVMRQELQQWTKTYEEASKELSKQKTLNEDSLFPIRSKVKQLHADTDEKREKINDLKMVIHKNSFRIEKLLSSGDVQ